MSEEQNAHEKVKLLFIGRQMSNRSKPSYAWIDVTGLANDGSPSPQGVRPLTWSKSLVKSIRPGIIYEMEGKRDENGAISSVWSHTATIVEWWKNQDDVRIWQAQDEATASRLSSERAAAALRSRNVLLETLKPFRVAYWHASPSQQAHILGVIISYIITGETPSSKKTGKTK